MNILYTLPDLHFGGTSNLLYQNIENLAKVHKVYLIYFGPNTLMEKNFIEKGIMPLRIPYNGAKDLLKTVRSIRKFIKINNIDIIHTNLFLDKALITFATLGSRSIKKVSTIHSADNNKADVYLKNKLKNDFENIIDKYFMDKIIAVSETAKRFSIDNRGIPEKKITVIYNGIQALQVAPYNNNNNKIVFGTACRFHSIKGLPRLLKTIFILKEKGLKIKLILIGDGGQRSYLEKVIENLQIDNDVEITGFTDDVPFYLSGIDYYVNSSYSEAMPISVLEALSIGLPVIASDVGGLKEIVKNNYNGLRVDFNNLEKTADEIFEFLNNGKTDYWILKKNSVSTFESKFSSGIYLKNLNALYENL
ncbi:glycosyltransferase family 4 protein [Salegentibacter maritimus]|uniref:glycosyltransferase family 4 protein n=1 Tax=Salegentibacter maritimus TaxID=2794347 RepID=UPI0018E400E1|nr:glycosyltransferase family 4 protein [Salegentibacter maritimus]MBI6117346.1 glycosyltransferase family 4 protein [Salegentibacter maritimus]